MKKQTARLLASLGLLSLVGCSVGPFITNIEPLGNGKVRITEARGHHWLFGVSYHKERVYELDLMKATVVTGSVSHVGASGNLITIALECGAEDLESGARFAIYSEKGYKGEATVSEIDRGGKFCFARITLSLAKISPGDSASTNLAPWGNW